MGKSRACIIVDEEVRSAVEGGSPVVALESSVVTHGMAWPRNLDTTRLAQAAVRKGGATPATVAVVDGRVRVGLSDDELERLARTGPRAAKCSRRDLAPLLAAGATAGTTVAATMIFAHEAGIGVVATGGIGGVHRGGAASFDVSADLQELARTPVAVVCAGPKAVLDIGLTREYLETHGVPVLGYGTGQLPAFYLRDSGFPVDYRLETAAAIAAVIAAQRRLGLRQGMVIANPPPASATPEAGELNAAIGRAVAEAVDRGVQGKALTPWLLRRIEELTDGASRDANVALIVNNARLGAAVALSLSTIERGSDESLPGSLPG